VTAPARRKAAKPATRAAVTPGGQRTRQALIDAGIAVAERDGLAGLSINAVVAAAGLAKGTFYVHFADRDAFVDALHLQFYARVGDAVARAVEHLAPGPLRLARGIDAYLDACLADRGIKALLLETRSDANLTTTIAERERFFARLAAPSLQAMGWRDPDVAARLFVAMTSEAALAELEAGRRLPAVRRTLERLVETAAPRTRPARTRRARKALP
jgi:AcrR family transcriptional regulator